MTRDHDCMLRCAEGSRCAETLCILGMTIAQLAPRKAEKYLIDSGLTYTIVHPGGLGTFLKDSSPLAWGDERMKRSCLKTADAVNMSSGRTYCTIFLSFPMS